MRSRSGSDRPTVANFPISGADGMLNAPQRLAYRVDEVCALLGVGRRTVERAIVDGRLRSSKKLGVRLVEAESLKALFDESAQPKG